MIDILLRTRTRAAIATSTLTAGRGDYELPTADLLQIRHVEVLATGDTQPRGLKRLDPEDLLALRRTNQDNTSPSRRYAVDGGNLLRLYPIPSSADTMTITFVPRPTAMSAGTHDPSVSTYGGIPTEFHKAIEYYCLWQGADMDDDSSSAQGERYRVLYEGENGNGGELAKIRRAVMGKVGRRPALRIGPPSRVRTELLKPGQIGV